MDIDDFEVKKIPFKDVVKFYSKQIILIVSVLCFIVLSFFGYQYFNNLKAPNKESKFSIKSYESIIYNQIGEEYYLFMKDNGWQFKIAQIEDYAGETDTINKIIYLDPDDLTFTVYHELFHAIICEKYSGIQNTNLNFLPTDLTYIKNIDNYFAGDEEEYWAEVFNQYYLNNDQLYTEAYESYSIMNEFINNIRKDL